MRFPTTLRSRLAPLAAGLVVVLSTTVTANTLLPQETPGGVPPSSAPAPAPSGSTGGGINAASSKDPKKPLEYLSNEVVVGIHGYMVGWSTREGGDAGFDVDLARFLKRRYGFEITFENLLSGDREAALLSGKVHLVISNFSMEGASTVAPTKRRDEVIDFAGPYFLDNSGILYSEDKMRREGGLPTSIDVTKTCATAGTTAVTYLQRHGDVPHIEKTLNECMDLYWRSDTSIVGVVTDETILAAYGARRGLKAATAFFQGTRYPIQRERYGIGLPNNSPELCKELSEAIVAFLEAKKSGWDEAFTTNLAGQPATGHKPSRGDVGGCDGGGTPGLRGTAG